MTEAEQITLDLRGKWYGRFGSAPCPVCQPEGRRDQDALTLSDAPDGRLLAHCKKAGCSFRDLAAALGLTSGSFAKSDPMQAAQRDAERRADAAKRAAQAKRLWDEAQIIAGTAAEAYLRGRGITCALPLTLRFHGACWHGPTAQRYPALVVAVQGAGLPAVHRTYLRADGSGKAGLDGGDKLMLGATAGGAVRLTDGPGRLVVAEGVETGLSLACGLLGEPATIWAVLSTSGIRGLRLPPHAGRLTIVCDGDGPGRQAAHALAERAHARGWTVSFLDPGDGHDFNDILTGKAVAA